MNNYVARLLVLAFACNARIAAMQAKNRERAANNEPPIYGEADFQNEAAALEDITHSMAEAASYN